ncbi:MAG TPA: hypothetical protein VGC70_00640 [Burkholderiales bacterium]
MKLSLRELDSEIAEIEARIAAERLALEDAVTGCTNSLRDTVASPKTLLALAGIGFAMGKLMFGRKQPDPAPVAKKAGVLGLLTGVAGTALGLIQPKFGVGSIARWAASKALSRQRRPKPTTSGVRGSPDRTAPLRPVTAPYR